MKEMNKSLEMEVESGFRKEETWKGFHVSWGAIQITVNDKIGDERIPEVAATLGVGGSCQ